MVQDMVQAEEEIVTSTLHFRRLKKPKGDAAVQLLKAELAQLAGQHHPAGLQAVQSVSYLHGRGQALVLMVSKEASRHVLERLREQGQASVSYSTTANRAKVTDVSVNAGPAGTGTDIPPASTTTPGDRQVNGEGEGEEATLLQLRARRECQRALAAAIRTVLTRDSHERCHAKRLLKRSMQRKLQESRLLPTLLPEGHPQDTKLYARIYQLLGEPASTPAPAGGDTAPARVCPSKLLSLSLCDALGSSSIESGSGSGSGGGGLQELCGLVSALRTPLARRLRKLVCWQAVRCGRTCTTNTDKDIGESCQLLHAARPVTELPLSLREYAVGDCFTETAEDAAVKGTVNEFVAQKAAVSALTAGAQRCLILDGKNCNTSRAVLAASPTSDTSAVTRTAHDIFVPNYCSTTAAHMATEHNDVCTSYFGSVRAFLDDLHYATAASVAASSHPAAGLKTLQPPQAQAQTQAQAQAQAPAASQEPEAEQPDAPQTFGLVYLDYCCRFSCGYSSVEKSPRQDLAALFRYKLLHPRACIVICTATAAATATASQSMNDGAEADAWPEQKEERREGREEREPSMSVLDTIALLAEESGFSVTSSETAFRYGQLEVHAVQLCKKGSES